MKTGEKLEALRAAILDAQEAMSDDMNNPGTKDAGAKWLKESFWELERTLKTVEEMIDDLNEYD